MEMETDRREEEEEIRERYVLSMERIRAMKEETAVSAPFYDYFQRTADFILEAADFAETIRLGRLEERSLSELQEQNRRLYADIEGEAYKSSYANPAYAARLLGEEYGQILSFLYTEIRGMAAWAAEQRYEDLTMAAELFIEIYNAFEEEAPSVKSLRQTIYWYVSDYCDVFIPRRIREQLARKLPDMTKIIIAQRISSVRYAEQILVLDDGKIRGMGTHEELLRDNRIYQEIYESQKEGADL